MHVKRLHRSYDTDVVDARKQNSVNTTLHSTTNSVECSICAKRFASQHGLQVHFAKQHKYANTAFDDVRSQRKHGTGDAECVGTEKSASTFKCDVCSKTYLSSKSLSMHQLSQHTIKPVADVGKSEPSASSSTVTRCNICKKDFTSLRGLRSHTTKMHKSQSSGVSQVEDGLTGYDQTEQVTDPHGTSSFRCKCPFYTQN